jgi:hypothetical protein
MAEANALAYNETATITTVKSFIVQTPKEDEEKSLELKTSGACTIKLFTVVILVILLANFACL